MKFSKTLLFVSLLSTGSLMAQSVKWFAGKQNDQDPNTHFNNTTVILDSAYFYNPEGLTWDKSGNLWVTERNKIRLLYNGSFYNRGGGFGDGDQSQSYVNNTGINARFYNPTGIVTDDQGVLYIADFGNHAIRKMDKFVNTGNGQVVSTFAGALPDANKFGVPGTTNGTGTNAKFNSPKGIVRDANGNFYVTEYDNFVIRKITSSGGVSTLAGNMTVTGKKDGTGSGAEFAGPYGIAILDNNYIVVSDFDNGTIRKVHMTTGVVTTIAGSAGDNRIVDGSLSSARFLNPRGVAVADGKIYVCDASTLRVIDINAGTVSTFAGSKDNADNKDGVGANARFGILGGIAYDGGTKLYVTDLYYNVIKTVNLDNFAPVADFTANKTAAVVDEVITLSNTSSGKPATRLKWTITPNSYTVVTGNDTTAPFSIKFTVTGFYSVGLSVTNAYGTDSKQKNSYISVSTTGIKDISETEGLVIYPNPTTAAFNIESLTGNFAMSSVEIMDLNGRMICKRNCSNSLSENIDLTNVPSGLYFVKVYTSNGVKSLRLQKN